MAISLLAVSCTTASFEKSIAGGKYKEAEDIVKKMKGVEKYDCAEVLIREYLELEEYDKAVYVYEKITPEHCNNKNIKYSSSCHGASGSYEPNVTALFRKTFMEIGDYDRVWQYSFREFDWPGEDDSGHNAESYYNFMSDVILYLCSKNNKAEANRFLNHYSFWFYTRIDTSSYFSDEKPQFRYDAVRSNLQRIINTY